MKIINGYQAEAGSRRSFNALAEKYRNRGIFYWRSVRSCAFGVILW